MMQAQTLEEPSVDAPIDLEVAAAGGRYVLRARWQDGDTERELELGAAPDAAGLEAQRVEVEALLQFCYEAGFADASNPRFFAP